MHQPCFITAIGTPLTEDDQLHNQGLEAHLEDQWSGGIHAILVGGTMGIMQMQADETYHDLVIRATELSRGRGEVFIGVGDTSFTRTRDRVRFVNGLDVDGMVVLSPYFMAFRPSELVNYFHAVADVARKPVYLYDLPGLTGVDLDIPTIVAALRHPNIAGIKSSMPGGEKPQLIRAQVGATKRIMVAQPHLIDMYLRHGFREHLDGIYCVCPRLIVRIGQCAARGDWPGAAECQAKLSDILALLRADGRVWAAFTAMMNARGLPGRFAPRPYEMFDDAERQKLLADPVFQAVLQEDPAMV